MNWGKGIALFLISFIVFITTLAVILMKANADLESEDYYLKEIKFGEEIEAQQNAKNLNLSMVEYYEEGGLIIKIEGINTIGEAKLTLIRPDSPSKDLKKLFRGNKVYVPLEELHQGKYKVVVDWHDENAYQMRNEIWVK